MNWMRKFMTGRYGFDQLSIGLLVIWIIFHGIASFLPVKAISGLISLVFLAFIYYRIFSKNIEKRQKENIKFLNWWNPKNAVITKHIHQMKDKSHRYFKCPGCKKILRVPRGKGKLRVTCVHCKTQFFKKT